MARVSIGKAWDESVAFLKRESGLAVPVALAFGGLPGVVLSYLMPGPDMTSATTPAQMIEAVRPYAGSIAASFAINLLISLFGVLTITALVLRAGVSVKEAMNTAFGRFLPAVVVLIVLMAILLTPAIMLMAGGLAGAALAVFIALPLAIVLSVKLSLANSAIVAERAGAGEALKRSWALTRGSALRIFGFVMVCVLVFAITSLAVTAIVGIVDAVTLRGAEAGRPGLLSRLAEALLGAAFTLVVTVMSARIYAQLTGGAAQPSVPSSSGI